MDAMMLLMLGMMLACIGLVALVMAVVVSAVFVFNALRQIYQRRIRVER